MMIWIKTYWEHEGEQVNFENIVLMIPNVE